MKKSVRHILAVVPIHNILTALTIAAILTLPSLSLSQPTQSNATGPTNTTERSATTDNPQGSISGAALVPASGPAAHTPDPGTHVGAGNTAPGLYTTQLSKTGDLQTTITAANPQGGAVIQNPGVRSGTLPLAKGSSTVSQTNLGANNTGAASSGVDVDANRNRAPVSGVGSVSGLSAGSATGQSR